MKETALEIKVNSYPPQAKNLVDIWINYAKSSLNSSGIEFITFVHRRPKNPKNENRRIAGLKAQCISYLKDDTELVKMSVENFIYLMAKCGVDMEIKEAQR